MPASNLTAQDILKAVGGPESPVRLYPVRLAALDRLLGLKIESSIESDILKPLAEISPPDTWTGPYAFDQSKFGQEKVIVPTEHTAYVTHWVSDLGVYGMQEAVAYLAEVPFTASPDKLIDNAIALCNLLRQSYSNNRLDLLRSDDTEVHKLMTVSALAEGEPLPSPRSDDDKDVLNTYVYRLGRDVYTYWSTDIGEWLTEMYSAAGSILPESAYPFDRSEGPTRTTWDAKLREIYVKCRSPHANAAQDIPKGPPDQLNLDL